MLKIYNLKFESYDMEFKMMVRDTIDRNAARPASASGFALFIMAGDQ